MQNFSVWKVTLLVLVVGLLSFVSYGVWAAPSGSEVLANVDQAMKAESKVMSQTMTLITASGQQRTRELQMWSKQNPSGDQMLARFLAPADVRGTGILMNAEDMWLYLPALGRVRRVASHAKKGSFMGSDLSYDDMEQLGSKGFCQDFEASLLGEEVLEGADTYLLQLRPVNEDSDYLYLKMWVDRQVWLPRKIEYFGEKDTVLKVLTTWDLQQIEGRWVAQQMIMEDQQKGSKTVLDVQEVSFAVELDDALFSTRTLERGL